MASGNRFVYNPASIDIARSKINFSHRYQTAILHGDLVPVEITEILPGDSMKYKVNSLIRMSTPIAPIMDNIYMSIAAFFVPKRLVWSKTKEFYGENTEGYGIQTEVLEPRSTHPANCVTRNQAGSDKKTSIGAYLGLVRQSSNTDDVAPIACNPVRAFLQVYNDWFRNENLQAPYLWNHAETGDASRNYASYNGGAVSAETPVPKVCKKLDRFTSCLPWAQKSNDGVLLPLGTTADLTLVNSSTYEKVAGADNLSIGTSAAILPSELGSLQIHNDSSTEAIARGKLAVDLSQATAATINQLRLAFATQRYLEQLARSGSKYREYIKGIFGVNIGDTTAQMAEYLGGVSFPINVAQVLSTAGYEAGNKTNVGQPGAVSLTGHSDYLFTKSFVEPGYLVIVAYTKHDRSYTQGIDDLFIKHELFDYYNPKFANIGEVGLKKSNIYFSGKKSDEGKVLGFQEAWSDYRSKKDMCTALMSASNTNAYAFWNLSDNFTDAPVLNADFITENRDSIVRCLTTGATGPDYLVDLYFDATAVRPMPTYSIPGLIDHH